ncbi:MAG: hypothetical protein HY698_16465 [Deltaproteobacteria bacterium]|nr:hypothetical protein [Deltaproteobacteria bacterium]
MMERSLVDRYHHTFLGLARGMFINRLHVLRLTEVVRLQIRPNDEGLMVLPQELDEEMKKQAFDYILAIFPEELHLELIQHRASWMTVQ